LGSGVRERIDIPKNDLKGYNLENANLQEANLRKAKLEEANLQGANLVRANFHKANLWKAEEPIPVHKFASPNDEIGANPNETMGTRDDYTGVKFLEFSKKMLSKGATILGGCCEIKPLHIEKISILKN